MKRTMKEEGYTFVRQEGAGRAIFRNGHGELERFVANKNHASWGFRWRGTDWEFVSSVI